MSQILDVCGINLSWLCSLNPLLQYVLTKRHVSLFRLIFENLQLKCRVWCFEPSLRGSHPSIFIYTWKRDLQVDYPLHPQPPRILRLVCHIIEWNSISARVGTGKLEHKQWFHSVWPINNNRWYKRLLQSDDRMLLQPSVGWLKLAD
jgi:hypothetical protein